MRLSKISLVLIGVVFGIALKAQSVYSLMDNEYNFHIQGELNKLNSNFHTSIRPYYYPEVDSIAKLDSTVIALQDSGRVRLLPSSWWAKSLIWAEKKLFDEDFISVKNKDYAFRINPLVGFSYGVNYLDDSRYWNNTRGLSLDGRIGKKVLFSSSFYENQALLLPHILQFGKDNFVLPGQGRFKPFKEGLGADWGFANGHIAYKANKYFTAFLGHGRHFFGDGYRSLLLSDNAFNYPYFKLETSFWKIKYVNLYGQLSHIGFASAGDQVFDQKYFTVHYLSWNALRRLNISLFEYVSWMPTQGRGVDWQYLNPIIFFRPVEWQNGSADNVVMGANAKFKVSNKIQLYGQFVLDDLNIQELKNQNGYWANKYGFQAGVKASDIGVKGLYFQAEYNTARPYVYTHFDSINAYTHMNQPLAHPLGANFKEGIAILSYKYDRHNVRVKYILSEVGLDENNQNYGSNIFYSYNTNRVSHGDAEAAYGHYTGQGNKTRLSIWDVRYAYTVNPATNLVFEVGLQERFKTFDHTFAKQQTRYMYFGLRTALINVYNDFL